MGKTSAANSCDIDALNNNPANIIKQRTNNNATVYFNLITNFVYLISSDYLSIDFYNKYFTKDDNGNSRVLSDQDKTDILSKASNEPVNFSTSVKDISIIINNKKIGSIGISFDERFGGNFKVNKDFLDLGLYGNERNRTYNFSDVELNVSWIRELNISYANNINVRKNKIFDEISYGISIKPQFGLYYLATKKNNLYVSTNDSNIVQGSGNLEFLYSGVSSDNEIKMSITPAGFGLGFDVGLNARLKNFSSSGQLNIGLSLIDIGYINWFKNTSKYFYDGNYVITDITDKKQLDSLKDIIKGTKTSISSFATGLPTNIRFGLAYKLFNKVKRDSLNKNDFEVASISIDYIQGFTNKLGGTTTPTVGIGGEYNVTNVLSPRIGFAIGGREKFIMSLGLGIDTGPVIIDLGTYNITSIFNPKGTSKISGGLSIKFKVN